MDIQLIRHRIIVRTTYVQWKKIKVPNEFAESDFRHKYIIQFI